MNIYPIILQMKRGITKTNYRTIDKGSYWIDITLQKKLHKIDLFESNNDIRINVQTLLNSNYKLLIPLTISNKNTVICISLLSLYLYWNKWTLYFMMND